MTDKSRSAVIVSAARTPIGRFLGGLAPVKATDLGAAAIRAALDRSGIDTNDIEDDMHPVSPGEIETSILSPGTEAIIPDIPLRRRAVGAYLLTDQAYAVSIVRFRDLATADQRWAYYLGAALTLWLPWQLSTIAGVVVGVAYTAPPLKLEWPNDLVQIETSGPMALTGLYVAWRLRVPLIGYADGRLDGHARWLYRRCSILAAPSCHAREHLAAHGFARDRIDWIPQCHARAGEVSLALARRRHERLSGADLGPVP